MSIPKEPRALMINLMYLVLTAMLALNVSAEIINAFFSLEKGIAHTNKIIVTSNKTTLEGMKALNETKKNQFDAIVASAEQVSPIVQKLVKLIEDYREELVAASGGKYPDVYPDNPKYAGKPKGYKDIDTPQRLFVTEGRATKIKEQILATKVELGDLLKKTFSTKLSGVDPNAVTPAKLDEFIKALPLEVDEESWKSSGKPNWEAFTFGYMPVAALYPLFTKWQNDAYSSETAVIGFLADKMGKLELKFDQFAVFASSQKPYVLVGETYTATVSMGAMSSQAGLNMSAGGSSLKVTNGEGVYTAKASSVGTQKYNAKVSFTNPATNETVSVARDFFYEVGTPSVNVSADKMNVFYIGVDNPISIAAAGVSSNDVGVSAAGGGAVLKAGSNKNNYIVNANQQGEATISVSDKKAGKTLGSFKFRVKRIPDPVVKLAGKLGGAMGTGEMKAQLGLIPVLENFDFDAKCEIQSYILYYTKKRQDPAEIKGTGGRFADQALAAVKAAAIGDQYQFVDVKAKCPGDGAGRPVNSLAFTIK
jgi:gliding motility-associated protein GldM